MSAYLMDSASLSMLANTCRVFGLPVPESESAVYDSLLDENLKSIGHRYPDAPRISDWFDEGEAAFIYDAAAVPANARAALELLGCYDYQSCEHPEYRESFAYIYVMALQLALEPIVTAEAQKDEQERRAAREATIAALKPVDLYPKETAVMIRKLLKGAFPACKFSVVTERGSMVSSVRVSWTDGPTVKRVESLIGCFEAGRFDGMTDSYDYNRDHFVEIDGTHYRPCCKYVFTSRTISADLASRCIAQVAKWWGCVEVIPEAVPTKWGSFELQPPLYSTPVRPDLDGYRHDWRSCIHRAAENREEFAREVGS